MKLKISSYNKLSIRKYREIMNILAEDISPIEKDIAIIALLQDISEDDVYHLSPIEINNLQGQMEFLHHPTSKNKNYKSIVINGNKYKVTKDLNEINVAQYIDFQTIWNNNDYMQHLPEILSIFIIPDGFEYNEGYDIQQLRNDIDEYLDIETATNIAFFLQKQLVNSILDNLLYCRLTIWWQAMKAKDKKVKKQLKEMNKKYKELEKHLIAGYRSLTKSRL